jgi:hypothetical protein
LNQEAAAFGVLAGVGALVAGAGVEESDFELSLDVSVLESDVDSDFVSLLESLLELVPVSDDDVLADEELERLSVL